jgi:ABC-type glycerol-3-phosphate transport system permease component
VAVLLFWALGSSDFQRYLANTMIAASVTSVLSVTIGSLSAYAFTRSQFRGATVLPLFYLVVRMVPRITLVLPLYVIFTQLHLLNTRAALIVAYTTFALPFGIWMLIGFLKELPILWGQFSAAAVSVVLPVALVALILQRRIVSGLTLGAVKG